MLSFDSLEKLNSMHLTEYLSQPSVVPQPPFCVPMALDLSICSPHIILPVDKSRGLAKIKSYEALHLNLGRILVKTDSPTQLRVKVKVPSGNCV